MACCGCCCGRIPTFGLWPDLDEAEVAAAVKAAPIVVDHLCARDLTCVAVEDAEVDVVPVSWSPFTGDVVALVHVEATCRPEEGLAEALEPLVCVGVLAAAYAVTDEGLELLHVTEETLGGGAPSGRTLEEASPAYDGGGGGGFDWD
ncbi:MAG: hypothetical protein ACK4YP_12860, partial [Myxococcota bacterium]